MATYRIHKDLRDIPSEFFPLWGDTLDYERGMPQFREPPEFSEEGILELNDGEEYTYRPIRRLVAPHMQASSPTGHVELQDNIPPMTLHLSQIDFEMLASSYPPQWQQAPSTPAQSTSSHMHEQSSGDDYSCDTNSSFNFNHPYPEALHAGSNYGYMIPVEPSAMEETEVYTYPRAMAMYTIPGSTSAPHDMQWNSGGSVSLYDHVQCALGLDGSMTSPQPDVEMAGSLGLDPTLPYDTNNASGNHWPV